jgi:integrase
VDLNRDQITLLDTKSGETQYIPIGPERGRRSRSFARWHRIPSMSARTGGCTARWDAVRAEAGIVRYRWHDNRHSFASRLVQTGVPILTVNKLLRHNTMQTTMRYAHLAAGNLHDALKVLARSVSKSVTHARGAVESATEPVLQTVN